MEISVDTLEFQFNIKYQALIFLDKTGSLVTSFFESGNHNWVSELI
jgi:hypothetical protein